MVEYLVANEVVAGSNPATRSMKKTLEIDDEEIQWLLTGLNAADHESLLPTTKPQGIKLAPKVKDLQKKLKALLYEPKK